MILPKLFSKEKELRMVWRIERDGRISYIAGAAHLFHYSFEGSLRRYINNLDTVLLESPLDEASLMRVVDSGVKGKGFPSLYNSLDTETINKIYNKIGYHTSDLSTFVRYKDLFMVKESPDIDPLQIQGLRPWMAFFKVWFQYLRNNGWRYMMDVDAFKIAIELGKKVHFLETIEEQIAALDGIPFERIVNFFNKMDNWKYYREFYVKPFLKGDLKGIMSVAEIYPARCESIIEKRDPILYNRIKPFLEKGNTFALVGIMHIQGIKEMILDDNYAIHQVDQN